MISFNYDCVLDHSLRQKGTDRARTREVFAKPLEDGAVVRQYDDFGSFADAFPACFS